MIDENEYFRSEFKMEDIWEGKSKELRSIENAIRGELSKIRRVDCAPYVETPTKDTIREYCPTFKEYRQMFIKLYGELGIYTIDGTDNIGLQYKIKIPKELGLESKEVLIYSLNDAGAIIIDGKYDTYAILPRNWTAFEIKPERKAKNRIYSILDGYGKARIEIMTKDDVRVYRRYDIKYEIETNTDLQNDKTTRIAFHVVEFGSVVSYLTIELKNINFINELIEQGEYMSVNDYITRKMIYDMMDYKHYNSPTAYRN